MQFAETSSGMTYDGYGFIGTPRDPSKPSVRIEMFTHEFFERDDKKRLARNEAGELIDGWGVAITARVTTDEHPFWKKYLKANRDVACAQGREIETLLIIGAQQIDEVVQRWERNGYTLTQLRELRSEHGRRLKDLTSIGRGHGRR